MNKILISVIALFGVSFGALQTGTIHNAKLTYVDSLNFTVGTTNVVSKVRDASDSYDIIFTNALTVLVTNVPTTYAVSGIDTNTFVTNTTSSANYGLYNVYLVARGRATGPSGVCVLISRNDSAPVYQTAYVTNASGTVTNTYGWGNIRRKIGTVMLSSDNGTGTIKLVPFVQSGIGNTRAFDFYQSNTMNILIPALGTNQTLSPVNFTNYVPATVSMLNLSVNYLASNAAGGTYSWAPAGITTAGAGHAFTVRGVDTTNAVEFQIFPSVSVPAMNYKVSSGAAIIRVNGWTEDL